MFQSLAKIRYLDHGGGVKLRELIFIYIFINVYISRIPSLTINLIKCFCLIG